MKLKKYLQDNFITTNSFALRTGLNYRTLKKIVEEMPVKIHAVTIEKIYNATNGEVDLRHLLK